MRDRASLTLAGVLALLGFLAVTATLSARAADEQQKPRRAELVALIEERRELVSELDEDVEELRTRVAAARAEAARHSSLASELDAQARELAMQAGTVTVGGPGLVVRLENSNRQPTSPDEAGAYLIHDRDVQLVVNALFAAGAEAVAVNDSRVVATTPIRAAGDTIVVNFRPLSAPYVVEGIGADRDEFEDALIARRFRRWSKLFGLGFSVEAQDEVVVPGFTGRVRLSAATPEVR